MLGFSIILHCIKGNIVRTASGFPHKISDGTGSCLF